MISKSTFPQIPWLALIFLICLGSLMILPLLDPAGLGGLNAADINPDEDALWVSAAGVLMARFAAPTFQPAFLSIEAACLPPLSPPPKHS